MTTGVLLTPPIVQFTFNNGQLAVGGYVAPTVGGVSTAVYQDSGLTTPLPLVAIPNQTVTGFPLNTRGEPSTAAGASVQVFLTPNTVYVFTLFDAGGNQIWQATYVNGVQVALTQAAIGAVLFPQTAAETAAAVVPTALNYPEAIYLSGAQRFSADPTGVTDATAALQNWANGCGGVMIMPPNATFLVSGTITLPAGTIIFGNGSTINAPTTGYHVFVCKGTTVIEKLNFSRTAIANMTSWKAVNADNFLNAMPANTRVIVRDCIITNFDIGVYCDGGAAQNIIYAEVSACKIVINTLGMGGAASVRPTVNLNNCAVAVIKDNPLLDASDRVNDVNNIYCIGSSKVTLSNNTLYSGVTKVVSSASNAVWQATIDRNRFLGIPWILVAADTNPVRTVEITKNYFDTPVTQAVDVGCILLGSYTSAVVSGDSIESISVEGNTVRNAPCSVYYISLTAGNSIGMVNLVGNRYYNASASSAGTFPVVNYNAAGTTYRSIICANEDVFGNANTRTYFGSPNPFTTVLTTNVNEVGITGTRTGITSNSFTATLRASDISNPPQTALVTYTIRDGFATLNFPSIQGTSASTQLVYSGLPVILQPLTQTCNVPVAVIDGGTYTNNATLSVAPGSANITLSKNGSTAGFTNTATNKGISAFTVTIPLV